MNQPIRTFRRVGAAVAAVLLLAAPAASSDTLDTELRSALDRLGSSDVVSVIVRFDGRPDLGRRAGEDRVRRRARLVRDARAVSDGSLREVEALLGDPSVSRRADLWAINGVALTASAEVIRALADDPGVARSPSTG